jgi:hypothetical protein
MLNPVHDRMKRRQNAMRFDTVQRYAMKAFIAIVMVIGLVELIT